MYALLLLLDFLVMYSHFSMHTTTLFCLHVHDRFFTFVCNLVTMKICVRLHCFSMTGVESVWLIDTIYAIEASR